MKCFRNLHLELQRRNARNGHNYPNHELANRLSDLNTLDKIYGFWIARQGKHITMTNSKRIITIPRGNPINAHTMAGIIIDAGLSIDEFKNLL
jgi:hypothetical protein